MRAPNDWNFLNGIVAPDLQNELRREICRRHPLFGKIITAIMRRSACDDVLFLVEDADFPYYGVHLTWRVEEDPHWPSVTKFKDYDDFVNNWEKLEDGDFGSEEAWRFFRDSG